MDTNTEHTAGPKVQLVKFTDHLEYSEDGLTTSAQVTETHLGAHEAESSSEDQSLQPATVKMKSDRIQYMSIKNWINILMLGLGFFLVFTAFQTSAFVQTITLDSFLSPSCQNASLVINGTYIDGGIPITEEFSSKIGYYSLCLIYLMVALGTWVSVPIVAVFGPRLALVISGALYVFYIGALVRPYVPVIFLGAVILGGAGGILWTAQGQILIQNSSKEKMTLTSGVFWFMLQNSLIYGNIFFFVFLNSNSSDSNSNNGRICIQHEENYIIFGVFTVVGLLGVIMFIILWLINLGGNKSVKSILPGLQPSTTVNEPSNETSSLLCEGTADRSDSPSNIVAACQLAGKSLVRAFKMLFTVNMLLLSVTFIYTGYELNFWSGVYGTAVGRTQIFSKADVGLVGLFIGIGEIIGGGLFGILGNYTNRCGKDPVVFLGMVMHFVVYLLVFYNLPTESSISNVLRQNSFGALFNPSNIYVVMVCAFLLGLGDACFNTQIYSIIGNLYPSDEDSAPAMALFKFVQSLAAMVGFLTSSLILLQWQLLALVVLATLGTFSFAIVEWKQYKPRPFVEDQDDEAT